MSPQIHVDVDAFWRDGFTIVRSVFDADQIERFRGAAVTLEPRAADLLSDPILSDLLLDPGIVRIAREILGGRPVYFGDSSVSLGPVAPGFHKDNADKGDQAAPDWRGRYPILRMGVYMQDHSRNPGGLDLRRGSQDTCAVNVGSHVHADTRVGDVVAWNLRTSHSGSAMMLRWPRVALDPGSYLGRLLRRAPMGLLARGPIERVAAFLTYGLRGPHLDRYLAYLRTREYAVAGWLASRYSDEALRRARAAGVEVIDMGAAVREDPTAGLNRGHVPLPY